jgi:hypothetical protein
VRDAGGEFRNFRIAGIAGIVGISITVTVLTDPRCNPDLLAILHVWNSAILKF